MKDVIIGGILGVVATLIGVVVTHSISLQREKRAGKKQYRNALSSVAIDLQRALDGLALSVSFIPPLGAMTAMIQQGHIREMPEDTAADLLNMFGSLEHIFQLTKSHNSFCTALVASGHPEKWSVGSSAKDRNELVKQVVDDLPDLIARIRDLMTG